MLISWRSTDSQMIAKHLFDRWICVFGCPVQIHSDGGPNASSSLIKHICNNLGIIKQTLNLITQNRDINSHVSELTKTLASIHRVVQKNIQIKAKQVEGKQKFLRKELNVDSFVMVKIPPVKMSPLGTRFNGRYKKLKLLVNTIMTCTTQKAKSYRDIVI